MMDAAFFRKMILISHLCLKYTLTYMMDKPVTTINCAWYQLQIMEFAFNNMGPVAFWRFLSNLIGHVFVDRTLSGIIINILIIFFTCKMNSTSNIWRVLRIILKSAMLES